MLGRQLFRSPCLGSRIYELARGAGAPDVRARALRHLAGCEQCQQHWTEELALMHRLRTGPQPPASLRSSLLNLAAREGPVGLPTALGPGMKRPAVAAFTVDRPSPARRGHRRLVLAASVVIVGTGAAAIFALGPTRLEQRIPVPLSQFGGTDQDSSTGQP